MTLSEVLVSGQPIISFVWNSLGEGGASSNTMGSLEAPEQAKAEIWLQKILPCQTAHFSIGQHQWTHIHEDTLSVVSKDPSVKLGESDPELGTFWKGQVNIAPFRFPTVTLVLRSEI